MKALQNLVGEQTYKVVDNPDNRYNFFGLVVIEGRLLKIAENSEDYTEWSLGDELPEDVVKAISVMAENGADIVNLTGVITFTDREGVEDTYYLLTW